MRRRLSIRARVASWCAGLAVATGVIGVVVTLAITDNGLRNEARRTPPALATRPTTVAAGALGRPRPPLGRPGQQVPSLATVEGRRAEGVRVSKVLDDSRRRGLLTVLALTGVAVVAAWWAAGRMLSPIRRMTATAHEVATAGAGRRIGLVGPSDELHDLSDTIDQMLDRLDASFEGQRRFVADASHELRTPLAVLSSEVDVALDDENASPDELRSALTRVRSELQRASRLVGSLLHLSRAESVATREPHDLADAAEQAVAMSKRLNVGMARIDADLASAPVSGDPVLLDRMVLNLVENAFRYNVESGFVRIATYATPSLSIIEIENSGPLIALDQVERLFERFRRGARDEERRQGSAGNGLGLSIAEVVTRSHGGAITLERRTEGGLRAIVRLPRVDAGLTRG